MTSIRLTDEQIAEFKESFNLFDQDRNGYITTHELKSVIESIGVQMSDSDIKKMIKDYDKDKDGKINFEEFVHIMTENLNSPDYNENLKKTFHLFDKDGNGYISKNELKQAMQMLNGIITDEEIEEMLREADLNKDGRIDFEEFTKIINSS